MQAIHDVFRGETGITTTDMALGNALFGDNKKFWDGKWWSERETTKFLNNAGSRKKVLTDCLCNADSPTEGRFVFDTD